MKSRYRMFQCGAMFYCEDCETGQQKSLQTRDKNEARKILQAKNEALAQPLMNLVMAKIYLPAQDPKLSRERGQTSRNAFAIAATAAICRPACLSIGKGLAKTRRIFSKYQQDGRPRSRQFLLEIVPAIKNQRHFASQLPLHFDNQVSSLRRIDWCDQSAVNSPLLPLQIQRHFRRRDKN